MANGKWKHLQTPKRATKGNKVHLSFPFSFICANSDHWQVADLKSHEMKDLKEQERATKSSKGQQKTKTTIVVEKPNQAIKNQNEQQSAKKLQIETRLLVVNFDMYFGSYKGRKFFITLLVITHEYFEYLQAITVDEGSVSFTTLRYRCTLFRRVVLLSICVCCFWQLNLKRANDSAR